MGSFSGYSISGSKFLLWLHLFYDYGLSGKIVKGICTCVFFLLKLYTISNEWDQNQQHIQQSPEDQLLRGANGIPLLVPNDLLCDLCFRRWWRQQERVRGRLGHMFPSDPSGIKCSILPPVHLNTSTHSSYKLLYEYTIRYPILHMAVSPCKVIAWSQTCSQEEPRGAQGQEGLVYTRRTLPFFWKLFF